MPESISLRSASPLRKGAIAVTAVLIPILFFVILEMALRLFGYGYSVALFVDDPSHPGFLVMNPHVSKRYFSNRDNATFGNQEPFRKQKAPDTFRIFVLGESTTIGYPYMHNGSFHRWLQYRLSKTYPDREFEIINLALTAVNSYTVRDMAGEITDFQPDAVLIYSGHNEYYGAMGVGSTSYAGFSPTLIRLVISAQSLRIIQLATNAVSSVRQYLTENKNDLRENLMQRMVADQQIQLDSPEFRRGVEQFRQNLDATVKIFEDAHIPVLISNLVSNEKDLKPFISDNATHSALQDFRDANQALAEGKSDLAISLFISAKEKDLLRFRAPAVFNRIIADLPKKYHTATLVDSERYFRKNSKNGILGSETLLEHVHPNLFGYALLSDAFYEGLQNRKLLPEKGDEIAFDGLRTEMPITKIDSLKAVYEMMMLMENWPFNIPMPPDTISKKTEEEQLAGALAVKQIGWDDALTALLNSYIKQKNWAGALNVSEALALEHSLDAAFQTRAGKISMDMNRNDLAIYYLKRSFRLMNDFETARMLFVLLLKEDKPTEALTYLDYAAQHNTSSFSFSELQRIVRHIVELKRQYRSDTLNPDYSNEVAFNYLKFANTAAAQKYVKQTLRIDPKNELARKFDKQLRTLQQ